MTHLIVHTHTQHHPKQYKNTYTTPSLSLSLSLPPLSLHLSHTVYNYVIIFSRGNILSSFIIIIFPKLNPQFWFTTFIACSMAHAHKFIKLKLANHRKICNYFVKNLSLQLHWVCSTITTCTCSYLNEYVTIRIMAKTLNNIISIVGTRGKGDAPLHYILMCILIDNQYTHEPLTLNTCHLFRYG